MNLNTKSANSKLVLAILMIRDMADRLLNGHEQRGQRIGDIRVLGESSNIGSDLAWRAEDWMKGSYLREWAGELMARHEQMTMDVALLGDGTLAAVELEDLAAALDERAKMLKMYVYQATMGVIFRGTESSSNPMTLLNSVQKVEAAKAVLEGICGFSSWKVTDGEVIKDIFDGIDRREEEARIAARKVVTSVVWAKKSAKYGGCYYAIAYNDDGDIVPTEEIIPTEVTRKSEAMALLNVFASKQQKLTNRSVIIREMSAN